MSYLLRWENFSLILADSLTDGFLTNDQFARGIHAVIDPLMAIFIPAIAAAAAVGIIAKFI